MYTYTLNVVHFLRPNTATQIRVVFVDFAYVKTRLQTQTADCFEFQSIDKNTIRHKLPLANVWKNSVTVTR